MAGIVQVQPLAVKPVGAQVVLIGAELDRRAHRREALDVDVDRSPTNAAAARMGCSHVTRAREHRTRDEKRRAHLAGELFRYLGIEVTAGGSLDRDSVS